MISTASSLAKDVFASWKRGAPFHAAVGVATCALTLPWIWNPTAQASGLPLWNMGLLIVLLAFSWTLCGATARPHFSWSASKRLLPRLFLKALLYVVGASLVIGAPLAQAASGQGQSSPLGFLLLVGIVYFGALLLLDWGRRTGSPAERPAEPDLPSGATGNLISARNDAATAYAYIKDIWKATPFTLFMLVAGFFAGSFALQLVGIVLRPFNALAPFAVVIAIPLMMMGPTAAAVGLERYFAKKASDDR